MIHVGFSSSNLYAKFVGTAVLSLFENHDTPPRLPSITVHILHDSTFSTENREKFIYLAGLYGQHVEFHNVEELCADKIAEIRQAFPRVNKTRFTINSFFRILFPFVLPAEIEKGIFLDADTIVNLDIREFWQIELGDKVLGVVPENMLGAHSQNHPLCRGGYLKGEDYLNSGVLLMNLKLIREKEANISNTLKFFSENPQCERWLDQDVLNYCFASEALKLPVKFNFMLHLPLGRQKTSAGKEIYHFSGGVLRFNNPLFRLWLSYFMKTPWFEEDTIFRFYNNYLKLRSDLQTRMAKVSAIISGKTRAFFVEPARIDLMKKYFSIRDDETIIPAENEDSLQKLVDAMKASQGKCVFFIMTPKFLNKNFPFDLLTKEGFALDKDFVRGWEILSDAYGNPFNSYPLVQAM